jgi:hypothetical protein
MVNQKIENLFEFMGSTAGSIRILAETDLPQVRDAIEGTTPLPERCPRGLHLPSFVYVG